MNTTQYYPKLNEEKLNEFLNDLSRKYMYGYRMKYDITKDGYIGNGLYSLGGIAYANKKGYDDVNKELLKHLKYNTKTNLKVSKMRFQDKIRKFAIDTFGIKLADDKLERCHRFAEESVELLQACGYTKENINDIVNYVYNREVGDPKKEIGGVMVTLAALASSIDVDLIKQAGLEAKRAVRNSQFIKMKHNGKPNNIKSTVDSAVENALYEKPYVNMHEEKIEYVDTEYDTINTNEDDNSDI